MKQTGTCRPVCTGNDCITVNQDRVDFKTAEEACHERNGHLMTLQPDTDESILNSVSQELFGNFWIGLRLPAGACSNLSAPLRGYEWTSASTQRNFIPSISTWKDSITVCSPHCVSLSNDLKWTERQCSDKTDGYLCRTKHKDACPVQELSDLRVFQSSIGCSTFPCEHECKDVQGGYTCSCRKGYIPDSKDPRQCKLHCGEQRCPVICDGNDRTTCHAICPDGFLRVDNFCVDINECDMHQCDQDCKNTFGSFVCSCQKGFVLKDQVKCRKADGTEGFVITTPANSNTMKPSSASAGGFLWVWIVVTVAVVVLIFAVRFYVVRRQKRREQNSIQQSTATAPMVNI